MSFSLTSSALMRLHAHLETPSPSTPTIEVATLRDALLHAFAMGRVEIVWAPEAVEGEG